MTRYVAFLRGINLGRRRVAMSVLADLFRELKFGDVATFIASGNVIFGCRATPALKLEERIAAHLGSRLGFPVETFVRTGAEVLAVAQSDPFPGRSGADLTLHVGFLHEPLAPALARGLESIHTETDRFRVAGSEYFWLCRGRTTDSTVWALPALKALDLPFATMRNMTSVRKLAAAHLVPRTGRSSAATAP